MKRKRRFRGQKGDGFRKRGKEQVCDWKGWTDGERKREAEERGEEVSEKAKKGLSMPRRRNFLRRGRYNMFVGETARSVARLES
eukprot:3084304-Pleurochrysis_carterae.AAC.2